MNRIIKSTIGAIFALLILLPSLSAAKPRFYIRFGPPIVKIRVVQAAKPYRNAVWVNGHHVYRHGRYVYVRGHWIKARPGCRYIQPQWKKTRYGYLLIPGHFKKI